MKYRRGWYGDSHRHYLASKGISTNRYFVRHELKGNRGSSVLHSLYAQGHSTPEIASGAVVNPETGERIAIPEPVKNEAIGKIMASRRRKLIDVPEGAGGDAPTTSVSTIPTLSESVSFSPLQAEAVPVTEQVPAAPVMAPPITSGAGIAPIQSEGFEEPQSLAPLAIPENQGESESKVMTPGVPELPGFGVVQ